MCFITIEFGQITLKSILIIDNVSYISCFPICLMFYHGKTFRPFISNDFTSTLPYAILLTQLTKLTQLITITFEMFRFFLVWFLYLDF